MEEIEKPRTLLVSFETKVHTCGILLHLLMYDAPALQQARRKDPDLRVRVFLNPVDVSDAIAEMPDGSYEELAVGRPDYASGRSLENHLENVERLKSFNRSGERNRRRFRVLPKRGAA